MVDGYFFFWQLAELQGQLADSHAQASVLMEKVAVFEQERG